MKNTNILYIEDQTFFQEFIKNIIITRESKNFTQKQASDLLNININIIINLERGDLDKLENNVFVLGHIKTYLKWLNIEYQLFFQKINSKKSHINEKKDKLKILSKFSLNLKIKFGKINILTTLIIFSFISSAIIISLWILTNNKKSEYLNENINNMKIKEIENIEEKNIDIDEINNNTANNSNIDKENNDIKIDEAVNIKTIKIIAINDSWIEIQNKNGKIIISKILKKNENIKIDYDKELKLLAGNAGGINIEINNTVIKNLGKDGEVKRDISLNYIDLLKFNK